MFFFFFLGSTVIIQPAGIDFWEVKSSQDAFHCNRRRKRFTSMNIYKVTDCTTPKPNGRSVCCLFICLFSSTHFQFPQINQWFNLKFVLRDHETASRRNFIYWKDGFKGTVPRQRGWRENKLIKAWNFLLFTTTISSSWAWGTRPCAFDPPPPCFPPAECQKAKLRDSEWEARSMGRFFLQNTRKTCRVAGNYSRILLCR